jgi:hypothetical protein
MKIQIKHRFNGSILFEHECEENNIKVTILKGFKANRDLSNCDLRHCNLRNCNLRNCDLSNCDLRNCDLSGSILRNCDLSNCDLSGSDLIGSILPLFSKWLFSIKNNRIIKIGCREKTICEWDLWFASKEEFDTKRGTPEFKQIEAMYLAHKAYLTHLNS